MGGLSNFTSPINHRKMRNPYSTTSKKKGATVKKIKGASTKKKSSASTKNIFFDFVVFSFI